MSTTCDLYKVIYKLVQQIPPGNVSTYRSIAAALGDTVATRAVKQVLNSNVIPKQIPHFRVVKSNGAIGHKEVGKKRKKQLLEKEGIVLEDGKILNFENAVFTNFETTYPLDSLKKEQIKLSKKVIVQDMVGEVEKIAGVDASYKGKKGFGTCVVLDKNLHLLEKNVSRKKIAFPYIPTYFSYHELPVVQPAIRRLETSPDVLFVDGNGVLHPRLGFASHVGIEEEIPTIGVAKTLLCGDICNKPKIVGAREEIKYQNKHVGYCLQTYTQAKPVYVSPGHKVSPSTAADLTLKYSKFKLPEPIRRAHKTSNKMLKQNSFNFCL